MTQSQDLLGEFTSRMRKDYSCHMTLDLAAQLSSLKKPILITGHTGFKGTWLTLLLESMGIEIVGLSLPAENGSLYSRANRINRIPEIFCDIRDRDSVNKVFKEFNPEVVIHLAAQPLVLESFRIPVETFEINVIGTANILNSSFENPNVHSVIIATTDKVYQNDEKLKSFAENDSLKGKDPYSASKVGAESAVSAWQHISDVHGGPKVCAVRAGNVIGGGDFASNRILPDIVRAAISKEQLSIRNPDSTRPWQHVLDPLHGYLLVAKELMHGQNLKAVNFGPVGPSLSVREVVEIASQNWPEKINIEINKNLNSSGLESQFLQLNPNFAINHLNWHPNWSQEESIISTMNWWERVLLDGLSAEESCLHDINRLYQSQQ